MRSFLLAGLVVTFGAKSAMASFELMYLPSITDGAVYRYDPVNRVRMGQINNINAPVNVFYTGGALGLVDSNTTGNHLFDFNTGINEGFVNSSQFSSISVDGTTVSHASGSTFISMATTGGSVGSTALSTTTSQFSGARLSNGNLFTLSNDTSGVRGSLFSSSGALIHTIVGLASLTRTVNSNIVLDTTSNGTQVARVFLRDTAGTMRVLAFSLGTTGTTITGSSNFVVGSLTYASTSTLSLSRAHGGYYLVGADASSPTSATRFTLYNNNGVLGSVQSSWIESMNTHNTALIYGVSNVVAPEPGPMLALGVGVATLLRRKRKSSRS